MLRVFNVGNAAMLFAVKLDLLALSVSSISAVLLIHFEDHWLLLVVMLYLSLVAPLAYPMLYHRAYAVSEGLERAKLKLLQVSQIERRRGDASFQRRLRSISTKGVLGWQFQNV